MTTSRALQAIHRLDAFLEHCERRSFKSREVVARAGEPSESFFLVLEGTLAVSIKSSDGQDLILNYVNAGDFFGEVGVYRRDDKPRYASLQARSACQVAEIRYDTFLGLIEEFPGVLYAIGCQMADRIQQNARKLHDLAFVDTRGRIYNALTELCREPAAMTHPEGMQIKVSRQELARIVGCSREVAGRMLRQLEQDGLVAVSGHTIVVLGVRPEAPTPAAEDTSPADDGDGRPAA